MPNRAVSNPAASPLLPVVDFHCDLVTYLHGGEGRTPHDPAARASLPQLRAGGVELQVLALFAMTEPGSSRRGLEQARIFRDLVRRHADEVVPWTIDGDPGGRVQVVPALENGSAIAEEDEPLDGVLARLDEVEAVAGPLLYVSLTWVQENRFGGGNESDAGLKDDGRVLIERLAERGIALDVSHMSPRMADQAMDFLAARGLSLPVMASHSDFAGCLDIPRNLPDDVAREIIRRDGVIGLNWMRPYVGGQAADFANHLAHGLSLGGRDHLCLGADFFYSGDIPAARMRQIAPDGVFFAGFDDASCYPRFFDLLRDADAIPDVWLRALAHGNARRFLARVLGARSHVHARGGIDP